MNSTATTTTPQVQLHPLTNTILNTSPEISNTSEPLNNSCRKSLSSKYKGVVPQPNGRWGAQIYDRHQRVWLGTFSDEIEAARAYDVAAQRFRGLHADSNLNALSKTSDPKAVAELSFIASKPKAEIVDMLRKHTYNDELQQSKLQAVMMNKESGVLSSLQTLMFEKVLTPSDVGKLNRLVIPKLHAEKNFMFERGDVAGKGVLLNFEDGCTGKIWRFRYSYWNSSQSYVLTRGWRLFVKEKRLKAGDVVSFGLSTSLETRFFIDCKSSEGESVSDCTSSGSFKVMQLPSMAEVRVIRLFGVDISEERGRDEKSEVFQFLQQLQFKKQCAEIRV